MPNTDSINMNTVGWDDINWLKVEGYVFKQQKRIYSASGHGQDAPKTRIGILSSRVR